MKKLAFILIILGLSNITLAETKAGWDNISINQLSESCTNQLVNSSKQGYYARAKEVGNKNPKPFPEADMRMSFKGMCDCISNKASVTWTFDDFKKNSNTYFAQLIIPATKGGECSPKGIVEKALKKQK